MKKKTVLIKPGIFKYLLFLPLFLLSFCQSESEEPLGASEDKVTIDAKVLSLMKSAIQSDSDKMSTQNKINLSKSTAIEDDSQCTNFLYPMTFQVYTGDDPIPVIKEINSDEELIAFTEAFTFENTAGAFTPNYEMFIYFPIILLDTDGNETVLSNLKELEGTLQMAVQACESFNDGSDGGTGDDTTGGSDGSTGDDPVDGSDDGTDGGSGESSGGSADDGTGDGSDGSTGDGSDGGSGDGSGEGSDGSTGDSSGDGTDGGSGDGSDDETAEGSIDESGDNQNDHDEEYQYCGKNKKKVYICHKGKTICVSVNAIYGHMEHHEEDVMGTCDD